jgi:hypothetical protein
MLAAARRLAMITAAAAVTAALGTATAPATTINCQHAGHLGMEYVCYAIHDNGHRETFYAPGPVVRP